MVGSDGRIFAFGDAVFAGSMGGKPLNAPVQSLVPDPDGTGYWLVASDGLIFDFTSRLFYGSLAGTPPPSTSGSVAALDPFPGEPARLSRAAHRTHPPRHTPRPEPAPPS